MHTVALRNVDCLGQLFLREVFINHRAWFDDVCNAGQGYAPRTEGSQECYLSVLVVAKEWDMCACSTAFGRQRCLCTFARLDSKIEKACKDDDR
jgi:hypothetical protein